MRKYVVKQSAGNFIADVSFFCNNNGYNDKEIKAIKAMKYEQVLKTKYSNITCLDM